MIWGTSKISLNLDSINGQIWARGPRIYGLCCTEILQEILESIWEHHGTYYLWKPENQKKTKISEHACTQLFDFWNFGISKN